MKIHPEAYSIQADQYIRQEQTSEEQGAFQHAIVEDPLFKSYLAEQVLLTEGIRHHVLQEKAEEWFFKYQPDAKKIWQKKPKKPRIVPIKVVAGILFLICLALYFQFNTENAVPMVKIVPDDSKIEQEYGGDEAIETLALGLIVAEIKEGKLVHQQEGKIISTNIRFVEEGGMAAELLADKLTLVLPKAVSTAGLRIVQLKVEAEALYFLHLAKEWYPLTLGQGNQLDTTVNSYYKAHLNKSINQQ